MKDAARSNTEERARESQRRSGWSGPESLDGPSPGYDCQCEPAEAQRLRQRGAQFGRVSAALAMLTGLLVLIGWMFQMPALASLFFGQYPGRPLTACGFILAGAAILLLGSPEKLVWRRVGRACAAIMGLLGATSAVEYLLEPAVGLNALLARTLVQNPQDVANLQMAPICAIGFIALAVYLLCLDARTGWTLRFLLLLVPLVVGLLALLGHAYGAQPLTRWREHSPIGFPSALGMLLLPLGAAGIRPELAPAAWLTAATPGGFLARRLLPAAIAAPLAIGLLRLWGEHAGWYSTTLGLAFHTLGIVAVFFVLILYVSRRLEQLDRERTLAEASLRRSEQRFKLISRATNDALWEYHPQQGTLWWSEGVERAFGYDRRLIPPDLAWWESQVHPEDRQRVVHSLHAACTGTDQDWAAEYRFRRADGTYAHVLDRGSVGRDAKGRAIRVVGGMSDITLRKEAEDVLRRSESHLRRVLNNLFAFVAVLDVEGTVLDVNLPPLTLAGLRLDQVRGRRFWDCYWWLHDEVIRERIREACAHAAHGRTVRFDIDAQIAGGQRLTIDFQLAPLRDDQGRITHLIPSGIDLTERVRAERAIREINDRLSLAQHGGRTGIFDWIVPERRVVWTPELEDLYGIPRGSFEGTVDGWRKRVVPDDLKRFDTLVAECFRARRATADYEFRAVMPDGSYRWLEGKARFYYGEDGRPVRMIGVNVDVHSRKQAEEALAEANAQIEKHARLLERTVSERTAALRETVDELERFSYSLSHDLRAPLRAMRSFAQLLQTRFEPQLGPEGTSYVNRISAAAKRLDQLITDVLTYSRIVGERVALQPVDPERLVRQLIEENPVLQPPAATVILQSPLLPVLGNEAYLTQVLSNLLFNAVKFISAGDTPRVRIWTEQRGARVRLHVQDNGIGIPPEAQERIFGMFERVDRNYEGTGIGLAIVKKAILRMDGTVGVESAVGQGSTFWFELRGVVGR